GQRLVVQLLPRAEICPFTPGNTFQPGFVRCANVQKPWFGIFADKSPVRQAGYTRPAPACRKGVLRITCTTHSPYPTVPSRCMPPRSTAAPPRSCPVGLTSLAGACTRSRQLTTLEKVSCSMAYLPLGRCRALQGIDHRALRKVHAGEGWDSKSP